MRLNFAQIQVFTQILDLIKAAKGINQQVLARQINVSPVELSKAKKGFHVSQERYKRILAALQQIASELGPEILGTVIERIELLRLAATKTDPFNLAVTDIRDQELARAYQMLVARCGVEPGLARTDQATHLWTVSSTYMLPKLADFYASLRSIVGEMARKSDLTAINHDGVNNYRRVINSSFALTTSALQLFPFYLTADRRLLWGVIPYGKQTKLGIAISASMLAVSQVKDADRLDRNGFVQLIESGLIIHNVAPYSAQQILLEMLARGSGDRLLMRFNSACLSDWLSFREAVGHLHDQRPEDMFNRNALVYDLAEAETVRTLFAETGLDDFVMGEIVHGVPVPVGIGYSLQILGWIAKQRRFESIRSTALSALEPLRTELDQVGIEIAA